MSFPDNSADYHDEFDDDGEELPEAGDVEALVWNLLLLINPNDPETALRQFDAYREAVGSAQPDGADAVWQLKDVIDWTSGFHIDGQDGAALIDCLTQLVARWNLEIDWGGDVSDDDFLDQADVPSLMAVAYDRLREHGYTLWNWNSDDGCCAGWIALSRDDEGMQQLAALLDIELRPGSDAF